MSMLEIELAAQLEEVRAERDALAAHVERLRTAGEQAVNGFSLHGLGDIYEAADMHTALQETPATSLARLKAQLVAQLEEARAERDWAHCEMNEWRERHDALFDEALRLKAQWQAEALEPIISADSAAEVLRAAANIRHQAEADQ